MFPPSAGTSQSLRPSHLLLAIAIVAVWGTNFVIMKIVLGTLPPLLFATLRFGLAAFPLIFFLKRPAVPWSNLAAYGALIGAGQFGLLMIAIRSEISPGLASLVVQTQVIFTIGLSAWSTRERVYPYQGIAVALAIGGLAVIALHAGGAATPLGLGLVVIAGLSWALGNMVAKRAGRIDILPYIVWSSPFAVLPLLVMSLVFEGPHRIVEGVQSATVGTWGAIVWQSVGNTMFGYGMWAWLLARYPAATIAPLSLLVPVFGMGAAAIVLAEPLPAWKLIAAGLVLGGLAINVFWPMLRKRAVVPA